MLQWPDTSSRKPFTLMMSSLLGCDFLHNTPPQCDSNQQQDSRPKLWPMMLTMTDYSLLHCQWNLRTRNPSAVYNLPDIQWPLCTKYFCYNVHFENGLWTSVYLLQGERWPNIWRPCWKHHKWIESLVWKMSRLGWFSCGSIMPGIFEGIKSKVCFGSSFHTWRLFCISATISPQTTKITRCLEEVE